MTEQLRLRDVFHRPMTILKGDNFDSILRGFGQQKLGKFDNKFTPQMTEFLFAQEEDNFGLDIVALNIQRGRDHQIQGYTFYK